MLMRKNGNNDVSKDSPIGQMLLDGDRGAGNEHGDPESEKWEQNRELEMKLLIGRTG